VTLYNNRLDGPYGRDVQHISQVLEIDLALRSVQATHERTS
jgi:hypothetical protein